jgi:hypothetical protein
VHQLPLSGYLFDKVERKLYFDKVERKLYFDRMYPKCKEVERK